jgi:hypothetical protein
VCVEWIQLVQDRDRSWARVNTVTDFRVVVARGWLFVWFVVWLVR